MPFAATWMNLEINILSEVSQTEKDKYYMKSLYVDSKKMMQMNVQNRNRLRQKTNLWLLKGKAGGAQGDKLGV